MELRNGLYDRIMSTIASSAADHRMEALVRGSVKADNSCLFTATARLCEDIAAEPPLKAAARRPLGADAVLADPDPATRAVLLGHDSVEAYAEGSVTSTTGAASRRF